jgi:four helix bundle protein
MNKYEIQKRLKKLAFSIAAMADLLPKNSMGRYFENQIIRSAFSAASNYCAACIAQSKASFVAKLSIAFEECDESLFWLECIEESNANPENLFALLQESKKLAAILAASRKTAQER